MTEVGRKALIETHSLAERVAGIIDADLRAEWGLCIFITEVHASTAQRISYAGHAGRVVRIRRAAWAGERFFNLVRTLSLALAVVKRRTDCRDEWGSRQSWQCS